jgi:hypothetical protein
MVTQELALAHTQNGTTEKESAKAARLSIWKGKFV